MLRDLDWFNGWLNTLPWPIALVLSLLAIAGLLALLTVYGVTIASFCHLCRLGWRDLRQQDEIDRLERRYENDMRLMNSWIERLRSQDGGPQSNVVTLEAASGEQDS